MQRNSSGTCSASRCACCFAWLELGPVVRVRVRVRVRARVSVGVRVRVRTKVRLWVVVRARGYPRRMLGLG